MRLLWIALALSSSTACLVPGGQPLDASVPDPDGGDTVFCVVDEDCAEGLTCLSGVCSDHECETKITCPAGQVCTEGWCQDPPAQCAGPDDCPGDWVCEGFTRSCIDPSPSGCETDGDCALEPGCENGCTCTVLGICQGQQLSDGGVPDAAATDAGGVDRSFDAGPPPGLNLGGYRIENRENSPVIHAVQFPDGTRILPGGLLIIGRDATQAEFEQAWGLSLGTHVTYLTSHAESTGVPIINGGERWALLSPSGTLIDGITITGSKKKSYQRVSAENASYSSSWSEQPDSDATPGSSSLPASGVGLVISEWSDASALGMYPYEFIELYYAP